MSCLYCGYHYCTCERGKDARRAYLENPPNLANDDRGDWLAALGGILLMVFPVACYYLDLLVKRISE